MKRLSLVNLYKAEIKKNMLAQIKGGSEVKCICTSHNPAVTTNQTGGSVGEFCSCNNNTISSTSVHAKPY